MPEVTKFPGDTRENMGRIANHRVVKAGAVLASSAALFAAGCGSSADIHYKRGIDYLASSARNNRISAVVGRFASAVLRQTELPKSPFGPFDEYCHPDNYTYSNSEAGFVKLNGYKPKAGDACDIGDARSIDSSSLTPSHDFSITVGVDKSLRYDPNAVTFAYVNDLSGCTVSFNTLGNMWMVDDGNALISGRSEAKTDFTDTIQHSQLVDGLGIACIELVTADLNSGNYANPGFLR